MISTAHIVYGDAKEDSPERVREIRELSDFLANRVKGKTALYKNLILLGDFNILVPKIKPSRRLLKTLPYPMNFRNCHRMLLKTSITTKLHLNLWKQ